MKVGDMKNQYTVTKFPASRLATVDLGVIARKMHHVAAFLEIDVTAARERIKSRNQAGGKITFVAWLVQRIACALENDKAVNARLWGKRRKVSFEGAAVNLTAEIELDGQLVPVPILVEDAARKTLEAIAAELRRAGETKTGGEDYQITRRIPGWAQRLFFALPGWLRVCLTRAMIAHPLRANRLMGSASFTSAGMAGNVPAWILPKNYLPLCFALGSIVKKPWVRENRIEIRQIAHLTFLADHDVVDGAPLARFIRRFVAALEKAEGL
jgi:pyruvate/2-oxoglutarate dehydrogenase complex dihydrolipoamide acyltransferase (E2) component